MPDFEVPGRATTGKAASKKRVFRAVRYNQAPFIDISVRNPAANNPMRQTMSVRLDLDQVDEVIQELMFLKAGVFE